MIATDITETDIRPDEILRRDLVWRTLKRSRGHYRLGGRRHRICFTVDLKDCALTDFNQLALGVCNRSAVPMLVEMVLSGKSANDGGKGANLFSGGREVLAPGQRREIKFPAEAFGFYGLQRDWRDMARIDVIFKKEKTETGDDPIDVDAGPLYGERRAIPPGPRLTDAGLSVRLRKDSRPTPSPRGRPSTSPIQAPHPHFYPEGTADEILAGRIMGHQLTFPISWDFSPDGTQEWTHFLNRHHFLRPVLQAFLETGEGRYLTFIEDILCHWIRTHPVPLDSNGGAGPSWETLSTAWRLREWLWVWKAAGGVAFRDAEAKRMVRCSLWEHCRHLMDHRGHPNNWLILEAGALTLAGMALPEFQEAPAWQKEGLLRLRQEMGRQFLPDGVHGEFSPFYQALCLHILLEIRKTATGLKKRLPAAFNLPLEKAADYLGALCRPDFTWPSFNDSGGMANDYSSVMALAGDIFGRDDFIWIAKKGKEGKAPRRKIRLFRSAGMAVMRSGNREDADYLLFRAGPAGASHGHEDVLSLDVAIAGVPCLVDPGITAYAPGPLTDYYRSALAHNMILINGKGPTHMGRPYQERMPPAEDLLLSSHGPNGWTISGLCRGYRGKDGGPAITVTRRIAPANRRGWVLTDVLDGSGNHGVTVCWQFAPGRVQYDPETKTARFESGRGASLALILLAGDHEGDVILSHGDLHPPLGWVSLAGRDMPAPHLQYAFTAVLPLSLVWEIRPGENA